MAERIAYSEKFLMPDLLGLETATSRTSMYRAKRIRIDDDLPSVTCESDLDIDQPTASSDDWDLHTDDSQHHCATSEVESDSDMNFHQTCDRSGFLEELDARGREEPDNDDVTIDDDTVPPHSLVSCEVTYSTSSLYEGSSLTLQASSVLVMQFKSRHNLTLDGLADLLKLLKIHCPVPNQCLPTHYLFMKQICKSQAPYRVPPLLQCLFDTHTTI